MIEQFETLIYNGFPFPVESKLTVEFDPTYDRADRAVIGVRHTLTVVAMIRTDKMAGTTVNGVQLVGINESDLPVIKAALTKPGQALVLSGTGFGDLTVNGGAQKQDSVWGPKPRRCSFTPLGTTSCVLRWTCDVQLPVCADATFTSKVMDYNYTVSVTIDEQGYCTRVISGYFEIPETRDAQGDNVVGSSALDFWNASTEPPVPFGFRRTQIEATDSEDRRRVNFRVVDTETNDVILPPNVVECRASHVVQTADKALKRMIATLRASYTMRKGVAKQDAFIYFLLLIFQKWRAQTEQTSFLGVSRQSIIPVSMTLEDPDLYGRQAGNFSLTWTYVNGDIKNTDNANSVSAQNLVPNSALWNPGVKQGGQVIQSPLGNSYSKWRASMDAVFGYNHPKFTYQAGDDVILDLCGTGLPPTVKGQFFRVSGYSSDSALYARVNSRSFLRYSTVLKVDTDRGEVFRPGQFIPGAAAGVIDLWWGAGAGKALLGDIQKVGQSKTKAYLGYDILMAGTSPPAVPVLSSVQGVDAIFVAEGKHQISLDAVLFGVPVFRLVGWDAYVLKTAPGNLPAYPPNYYLNDGTVAKNSNTFNGFTL